MSSNNKMEWSEDIQAAWKILKLNDMNQITRNMQQDTLAMEIPKKQPSRVIIS